MANIIIERIAIEHYQHPKHRCNFNKNPDDLEIADLDYDTEIAKTDLTNYAHLINYPIDHVYTFTPNEIKVLLKCIEVGILIGRPSHIFDDDLEPIKARLRFHWIEGKMVCPI